MLWPSEGRGYLAEHSSHLWLERRNLQNSFGFSRGASLDYLSVSFHPQRKLIKDITFLA
jgi:hypothetical protein